MGEGLEERKIHWVKWEELCADHRCGGLGLKNLEWFNVALLAKWLWRFLLEKESLWARVIRACQGNLNWDDEGFRVEGNRRMRTGWWKNILSLSWGEEGQWLRENLEIQLGEGASVLFWYHIWAGNGRLSDLYPRLFRLSTNQEGSINSMGEWIEGEWVWKLRWNRELRDREHEQVQWLTDLINKSRLTAGKADGWKWKASTDDTFSVKSAYKAISSVANPTNNGRMEKEMSIIWKAPAPP